MERDLFNLMMLIVLFVCVKSIYCVLRNLNKIIEKYRFIIDL